MNEKIDNSQEKMPKYSGVVFLVALIYLLLGSFATRRRGRLPPSNICDAARLSFASFADEAQLRWESDAIVAGRDRPAGSQWVGDDLFMADGELYATRLAGGLVVHRNSLLNMEKGADLVTAAERRYVEAKRKTPEGFFDALLSEDDLWSTLPFLGMVADIGGSLYTAKKSSDINEKVRNGEQLTVEEAVALKYYMEDVARKVNKQVTVGFVVGDIYRLGLRWLSECWLSFSLVRSYLRSAIRERTRILAVVVFLLLAFAAYFVTIIYQSHVLAFIFGVFAFVVSGLLWGKARNHGDSECFRNEDEPNA